jgi:hypothetical protein
VSDRDDSDDSDDSDDNDDNDELELAASGEFIELLKRYHGQQLQPHEQGKAGIVVAILIGVAGGLLVQLIWTGGKWIFEKLLRSSDQVRFIYASHTPPDFALCDKTFNFTQFRFQH